MTRLTDEELARQHALVAAGGRLDTYTADYVLTELRERRAADLTDEERKALRGFRDELSSGYSARVRGLLEIESRLYEAEYHTFIVVLDKLLAGGGGR